MPAGYYSGTELYATLAAEQASSLQFSWPPPGTWLLVYADKRAVPRVVLYVEVLSKGLETLAPDEATAAMLACARFMGRRAQAAVGHLRVVGTSAAHRFYLSDGGAFVALTPDQLAARFTRAGVPISASSTAKPVNVHSSSPYHEWQRQNLGHDAVVTDIDLLRLNDRREVSELIEIKRSHLPLETWRPYEADRRNFVALARLGAAMNVPVTISYHVMEGPPPRREHLDRVAVWSVSASDESAVAHHRIGIRTLAEFAAGDY